MITDFFIALTAGLVTVGGPCVLPLLPVVLGSGVASRDPRRPAVIIFGFCLSFAVFASAFGLFGRLLGLSSQTWRLVAAGLITLFGLIMLFPKLQARIMKPIEPWLNRLQPRGSAKRKGLTGGFLVGLTLGAVWTPCAGPALAAILTLMASHRDLALAGALLIAFTVGAGLPMLLIAYGGRWAVRRVRAIAPHAATIQRVFGGLIVLAGIAMLTGLDSHFHYWTLTTFPGLFGPDAKLMCSG
jgi:cytochrome c biogenesis protein CcdA